MAADLLMPKLGLNMTEGMVAAWSVGPGDSVAKGDTLFTVETDKITTEIEAVAAGEIVEILVQAGETVPVGVPIARWTGGDGRVADIGPEPVAAAPPAPAAPQAPDIAPPATGGRIVATPYARRRARELDIDLGTVVGSGPNGRIKAADIDVAATRSAQREIPADAPETPTAPEPVPLEAPYWISVVADIDPARALLQKLGPDSGWTLGIVTVVTAAVASAHDGPVVLIEGETPRLFPAAGAPRLKEIADGTGAAARLPEPGENAGALRAVRKASTYVAAPVTNTTFTLGVGHPAGSEVTLTLSARESEFPAARAEVLLSRIATIIEMPTLLLLGGPAP